MAHAVTSLCTLYGARSCSAILRTVNRPEETGGTPEIYWQTVVLAVLLGVLGGVLPAYRATQISPVEALHYE